MTEILFDCNLKNCYTEDSFLRHEELVIALIKSLQKLENRELCVSKTFKTNMPKLKKTNLSSSLPNVHLSSIAHRPRSYTISTPQSIPISKEIKINSNPTLKQLKVPEFSYKQVLSDSGDSNETPTSLQTVTLQSELRSINIVKCDDIEIYFDRKHASPSTSSTANTPPTRISANLTHAVQVSQATPKPLQKKRTWSILPFFDDIDDGEAHFGTSNQSSKSTLFSKSAPSTLGMSEFIPQSGIKIEPKHVSPMAFDETSNSIPFSSGSGFFPKPIQGQSLASFLQTAQFSRTNTEIERENAHFSVAEAMISAIEQIKWMKVEKLIAKQNSGSDIEKKKSKVKKHRLRTWINDAEKNQLGIEHSCECIVLLYILNNCLLQLAKPLKSLLCGYIICEARCFFELLIFGKIRADFFLPFPSS